MVRISYEQIKKNINNLKLKDELTKTIEQCKDIEMFKTYYETVIIEGNKYIEDLDFIKKINNVEILSFEFKIYKDSSNKTLDFFIWIKVDNPYNPNKVITTFLSYSADYNNDKKMSDKCYEFFSLMLMDIKNLKIDNNGEFEGLIFKDIKNDVNEKNKPIKSIIGNDNVNFDLNDCCVCYEETEMITKCGHSICFKCSSKIEAKEENDELMKKCPMCRTNFLEDDDE